MAILKILPFLFFTCPKVNWAEKQDFSFEHILSSPSPPPQTLPPHLCECITPHLGTHTGHVGIFPDCSFLFAFSNQFPSPRTFISFHCFATSAMPHLIHSFFLLSSQRSLPAVLPADTLSPLPILPHCFPRSWKNTGLITALLSWNPWWSPLCVQHVS